MKHSISYGFTLIEILVAVSIMSVVSGAALAGFGGFTNRQTLTNAQSDLVTVLQTAKSRAQSQYKDSRCDDLHTITYWYVEIFSSTSYQLAIQCINWSLPDDGSNANGKYAAYSSKIYKLPSDVTFSSPYQVAWFSVNSLSQANNANVIFWNGKSPTTYPSSLSITLTNGLTSKSIQVNSDGRIVADPTIQPVRSGQPGPH